MSKVSIALLQSSDQGSPQKNLIHTLDLIRQAASQGAQIICTQELFLSDYFCATQDTKNFELAEPIPGKTTTTLQELAAECQVVIIASLFEEQMKGLYYNTAAIIDADGSYLGKYRKTHIPQDPGFEEKFYFTPGDSGIKVWQTKYATLSVIICWDQWFPESARLAALQGAEIIFAPTAIGWLADEKAEFGRQQHLAWERVQCGHAVANSCYYAAINRVGSEASCEFWGQSFISDFYGDILQRGSSNKEEILIEELDLKKLEEHRQIWPFFRDRRIDSYAPLLQRHF